ncbi:MAG: hypothetical protein ACYDCK_10245 [Thermoplasmatota archaeon]
MTSITSTTKPRNVNASFATALPILPGRTQAIRDVYAACMGPRRAEFAASRERAGIRRELKWIQTTPGGDFLIRYVEADDAPAALERSWRSEHPFDVGMRKAIRDATGVDVTGARPSAKLLVDLDLGAAGVPICFVVPILPGKEAANVEFAKRLTLDDPAYADQTRRATIVRERVWQHETPHGSFSVLYCEARDPAQTFATWGGGTSTFDKWLRANILEIHGVDLSQPSAPPQLIAEYDAAKDAKAQAA